MTTTNDTTAKPAKAKITIVLRVDHEHVADFLREWETLKNELVGYAAMESAEIEGIPERMKL